MVHRWTLTRGQLVAAGLFVLVWIIAASHPMDRATWLMENTLVLIAFPLLVFAAGYFRISSVSFALIMTFLALHVVGGYWGYADVPFGWTLGEWLGVDRNMYDRLVHFSFGLLAAYPIRELFLRITAIKGFWSYLLPLDLVLSLSALFEIVEWMASVSVNGPVGIAYLGAQGDPWDTQEDMACAAVGALITMSILFAIHMHRRSKDAQRN